MKVRFDGYDEKVLTFQCGDDVEAGCLVKMSESETVDICSAGEDFIGLCLAVRDGYASVQVGGYVELPYSAAVAVGRTMIAAASSTSVQTVTSGGTTRLVVALDETNTTVGVIL